MVNTAKWWRRYFRLLLISRAKITQNNLQLIFVENNQQMTSSTKNGGSLLVSPVFFLSVLVLSCKRHKSTQVLTPMSKQACKHTCNYEGHSGPVVTSILWHHYRQQCVFPIPSIIYCKIMTVLLHLCSHAQLHTQPGSKIYLTCTLMWHIFQFLTSK